MGHRGRRSLQNLDFPCTGDHRLPVFICDTRSFSGGETPPLQVIPYFRRRGGVPPPDFVYNNFSFCGTSRTSPPTNCVKICSYGRFTNCPFLCTICVDLREEQAPPLPKNCHLFAKFNLSKKQPVGECLGAPAPKQINSLSGWGLGGSRCGSVPFAF